MALKDEFLTHRFDELACPYCYLSQKYQTSTSTYGDIGTAFCDYCHNKFEYAVRYEYFSRRMEDKEQIK